MAEQHITCKDCKYGEPVLADTRVWCKHPKLHFGGVNGLSFPKDWYCKEAEKEENE